MATRSDDPIKHVVVLMLENQSFDRMLGALRGVYGVQIDGVDVNNLYSNEVSETEVYTQAETRTLRVEPDPKHELKNVLKQIDKLSELPTEKQIGVCRRVLEWLLAVWDVIMSYWRPKEPSRTRMFAKRYQGAFVADYAAEYPESSAEQRREIMGYYPLDFLPAFHTLGRNFTVCDQWFASLPGPTWANRFFVHSGTALGRVWMPETKEDVLRMRPYNQVTLYDRLYERGIKWRIYFGDIPQSFVLTRQLHKDNIVHYRPMRRFWDDVKGPADEFPEYCLIEPQYFLSTANDDHPPHNTMHAQCLTADVYNAIRRNEELWNQTLLVIMYDEHGGFFDHVEPQPTVAPDEDDDEYGFTRFGVRVPVLLVSPWVKPRVLKTQFDHTSLLKYLTEKWQLGPLGKRVLEANSIGEVFDGMTVARTNTPSAIHDSDEMRVARAEVGHADVNYNGHQRALLALSEALAGLLDNEGLPAVLRAQARQATPTSEIEDAKQVIESLIAQEQRKSSAP
jgi:phospholipase C